MTFDSIYSIIAQRLDLAGNEARRLFHGRGQCYQNFEFLTVDWFTPVIFVTTFAPCTEDIIRTWFTPLLMQYPQVKTLVWQRRDLAIAENYVLIGELPDNLVANEVNLKFLIDLKAKQNTGFFLDMRHGREWLAKHCQGKKVLNLFSFTCAFSVVALAAGAESVVNIDMSKGVLARGMRNHEINYIDSSKAIFLPHNIFKSWNKLHQLGRYDIIIIDPPSRQRGAFDAEKDYHKVIQRLNKLLKPDADILACLNAPYLGEAQLDDWVLGLAGTRKIERLANLSEFEDINHDQAIKVIHYHYQRPHLS